MSPETASSFPLLLLLDNAINVPFYPSNIIVVNNLTSQGIDYIHALVVGEFDFLSNLLLIEGFFLFAIELFEVVHFNKLFKKSFLLINFFRSDLIKNG